MRKKKKAEQKRQCYYKDNKIHGIIPCWGNAEYKSYFYVADSKAKKLRKTAPFYLCKTHYLEHDMGIETIVCPYCKHRFFIECEDYFSERYCTIRCPFCRKVAQEIQWQKEKNKDRYQLYVKTKTYSTIIERKR